MAIDPVLGCTLLSEGTAQAEFLVNEMLARIIAGTVRVLSNGDTAPPGSPVNFDAYILGAAPTGAWSGQAGKIAVYVDGWKFITPVEGLRVRVTDDNYAVEYTGAAWVASSAASIQTLVDGATIAWDTSIGRAAVVTLGGNRTLAAPTNLVDGAAYILHVIQDATGSRTLTWNAVFKWPTATAPTLTTTPSKIDIFQFQARSGNLYSQVVGLNY